MTRPSIPAQDVPGPRTLLVALHRRPGALDRVVGLLRRNGCTLHDLTFGPSEEPAIDHARVTITGAGAGRVATQLGRLVDVVRTRELVDLLHSPSAALDPEQPRIDSQADGHQHTER